MSALDGQVTNVYQLVRGRLVRELPQEGTEWITSVVGGSEGSLWKPCSLQRLVHSMHVSDDDGASRWAILMAERNIR
jgi:hypothetical protein